MPSSPFCRTSVIFCTFQGSKEEGKAAWSMRHMRQGKMCGQGWFFSAPSPIVECQTPYLFCRLIPVKSSWCSLTSEYVCTSRTNLETKLEMNLEANLEMKHWINYYQKSLLQQVIQNELYCNKPTNLKSCFHHFNLNTI